MAYLKVTFICLIGVYVLVAIPESESANFPLDGCFTDEMDVLFMYFDSRNNYELFYQQKQFQNFAYDLLGLHSNKTTPRVMFADVIDKFSALNPHVNVSSWSLHLSPGSRPYGFYSYEQQVKKQQYQNVEEAIALKVTFVERLFFEMGGVRKNVTHIAVIFLDGSDFSFDERRSIPYIVQQQGTEVKTFFVVMIDDKYDTYIAQISDTLFVDDTTHTFSSNYLTLILCNQCLQGWFMFEHNDITNSLSCYKLLNSQVQIDGYQAITQCREERAQLSTVETKTELIFLQTKLFSYFSKYGNFSSTIHRPSQLFSAYVGLQRHRTGPVDRFHWLAQYQTQLLPVVVNHWMPGKPSRGRDSQCGVWQFVWDDHSKDINSSRNNDFCISRNDQSNDNDISVYDNDTVTDKPRNDQHNDSLRIKYCSDRKASTSRFTDGWVDVECLTELYSFPLCEIIIPRRIEDMNLLTIKPARNESFSRVLSQSDFIIFKDNIVSISANIASRDFLLFLKQLGIEFPLFDCGVEEEHPRYISYVYVCDFVDHCRSKRDETFCLNSDWKKSSMNECTAICNGVHCCDGSCLPLQFVNDGEIDCFVCGYGTGNDVHDESDIVVNNYNRNETCAFYCNNKCVSLSKLSDGQNDCLEPESPLDERIGKLQTANTCYSSMGQSIWAPRCVYILDIYGAVLGCRDMSHLNNCSEFECPEGYFKCPNTYCIPQHYVLDGKSDCPTGEDENSYIISPCSGNFACWNSQICLHPDLVCDEYPDCPYKDDEVDCDVLCHEGFHCMSGTIAVSNYNKSLLNVLIFNERIKYMDLSGVDLSVSNFISVSYFYKMLVIIWSNCKIDNVIVDYFFLFTWVRKMDLSYNLIQKIDGSYINYSPLDNVRHLNLSYNKKLVVVKYLQMSFLETLDLSHTGLTDIDESFLGLPSLKHLNLSFTFVTEFHKNAFHSNFVLQTLDLRGLTMRDVYSNAFNGLTIQQDLYTDSFELCCPQIRGPNIPHYMCHAPVGAISSCFNLIGVYAQRVLLWVVAVLAVLVNMTVIGYRVICDRSVIRTGYGLFVTNLGISDFIMGVYLFIIAGADYYYRDIYVLYDKIWRESLTCKFASFLVTLSCETSILFIFFITLDRLLIMKFPFGQIKFSKLSKVVTVLLSWIIGLFLALSPIVFNFEIFSSNAMCLGLPLTAKRINGWGFSFGVFIVFNFCMCLVIAYGQRAIYRAMSENRITETSSSASSRRADNITVAKQLSLVALSNFICWLPIGIKGLLSLDGQAIGNDVYSWIAVIVLPISSAANPLLHTIPVLMVRWNELKNAKAKTQQKGS